MKFSIGDIVYIPKYNEINVMVVEEIKIDKKGVFYITSVGTGSICTAEDKVFGSVDGCISYMIENEKQKYKESLSSLEDLLKKSYDKELEIVSDYIDRTKGEI